MVDRISFNPIYSIDPERQPRLADDLQWNFDRLKTVLEDELDSIEVVLPSVPADVGVELGHYEETFTAGGAHLVTHNLGLEPGDEPMAYPQVTVYNSANRVVGVVVDYIDQDTVRLNFIGTLTNATVCVDVGILSVAS